MNWNKQIIRSFCILFGSGAAIFILVSNMRWLFTFPEFANWPAIIFSVVILSAIWCYVMWYWKKGRKKRR